MRAGVAQARYVSTQYTYLSNTEKQLLSRKPYVTISLISMQHELKEYNNGYLIRLES